MLGTTKHIIFFAGFKMRYQKVTFKTLTSEVEKQDNAEKKKKERERKKERKRENQSTTEKHVKPI